MHFIFDFRMGGVASAGIGRYAESLWVEIIPKLKQHRITVLTHQTNSHAAAVAAFGSFDHVKIVSTNIRHYSLAEQLELPSLLKKLRGDLVHFPNFNVPVWYRGAKVVTIHDMVHNRVKGHKRGSWWKFYLYKYVMDQAVRQARRIITISESSKRDILDYYPDMAAKIGIVSEGVSVKPIDNDVAKLIRGKYGITKPYILFVGTLERKKHVPILAAGFRKFIESAKVDMDLVIAGRVDAHYPEVKEQILEQGPAGRALLTGFVTDEELAALYQGAYLFATASPNEGFGLPGLEAMHFGLPVVAANAPTLNEVYDSGALFFGVDDIDEMSQCFNLLVNDPKYYAVRQAAALARAENFSWERAATETMHEYERALGKSIL